MTNGKFDVYFVILTQGTVCSELAKYLIKYVKENDDYNIIIGFSTLSIVDNNRSYIVKKFLDNDWDYLIMVDEDNPPEKNPLDLVALNLDVIGCPTPMIKRSKKDNKLQIAFNIFKKFEDAYSPTIFKKDKLEEVDAVGSGCIIIRRQVLENIEKPFESEWNKDGTREKGSDLVFCEKVKEKGFKVWTHWDYLCSHYKLINLLDILEIMKKPSISHK